MYAQINDDTMTVRDDSAVWWPDAATAAEIATSATPEVLAMRICDEQPMRGRWVF